MICTNCGKQIPDDTTTCPYCGAPVIPAIQIKKEIKLRRWQRWFFYGVIVILFLAETAYAVKIYSDNTKLLQTSVKMQQSLSQTKNELSQVQGELSNVKSGINQREAELSQAKQQALELQKTLDAKAKELQSVASQKEESLRNYDKLKAILSSINAQTFNALLKMGSAISNQDLLKIPLADFSVGGQDSDGDGLPDDLEISLGTDKNKADSDGDGYKDKEEIINGYNPLGAGKLPLDQKFVNSNKGKILLQMESRGEAWYVNPNDGKRYFLGIPSEAVKALEGLQEATKPVSNSNISNNESINKNNNFQTQQQNPSNIEIPID